MKRFLILVLCVLTISSTLSFAQGKTNALVLEGVKIPLFFGITMGYNRSMHTAELPSIVVDEGAAPCPVFPEGSDNGFWFGITYEQFFGEIENSKQSLIVRAIYSTYPSVTQVGGEEYPTRVPQYVNGELVGDKYIFTSTEHNMDINYSVASLELCYKIKPIVGLPLGITIGPTFDYVLKSTWDQSFDLVTPQNAQFKHDAVSESQLPDGARFSNDYRSIILHEGDIENAATLRVGLKVGLQYEINIPGQMYLVPAIYYNLGLTNLTDKGDMDWRVNALQVGIDIRRSFTYTKD